MEKAGGAPGDAAKMRQALRKASFASVRGRFVLGPNQLPKDDYYGIEVVADPQGVWTLASRAKVLDEAVDPYAKDCKYPE